MTLRPRPAARRDVAGRRTVVLLAPLTLDDTRTLGAGRVVEAASARFEGLGSHQVRDANRRDVAIAGPTLLVLDLAEPPPPAGEGDPQGGGGAAEPPPAHPPEPPPTA